MAEISRESDVNMTKIDQASSGEISIENGEKYSEVERKELENSSETTEPRVVHLTRKNKSFGVKVRGQVAEGGPRWLIDGKVYKNLHTISAVTPQSSAEECGVKVGDKILSINDVSAEGVQHETIKDLMSKADDYVEMVLVSPQEATMLDIPSSLVIHRSDGSTTSINKSSLLRNDTIDEVLEQENENKETDEESVIAVQVHVNTEKQEEAEDQEEVKDENEEEIKENEECLNESNEGEKSNGGDKKDSDSPLIGSEQPTDKLEETVPLNEHTQSPEPPERGNDVDESDSELEPNSEPPLTYENQDVDKPKEENSEFEKHFDEDEEDQNEKARVAVPTSDGSTSETCFCGHEGKVLKRNVKWNKYRQQEKLIREMRMISASIKRLKVSPFSPDTFNNLSPYFSVHQIDEKEDCQVRIGQARSWRYSNQRPTALMVLDPADSLRLENSDLERQVKIWSSNFVEKEKISTSEANDEATKLRDDLNKIYTALMKKRNTKRKETINRYLHDEKFISLSKHFIKANAKDTILTYMSHWKIT